MLAVLIRHGAGDGDFFAIGFADLIVEVFADVVLGEEIVDGFAVFIDLEDVLAFIGQVEFAFAANHGAGEGRAGGVIGERGERGGGGDQGGEEEPF